MCGSGHWNEAVPRALSYVYAACDATHEGNAREAISCLTEAARDLEALDRMWRVRVVDGGDVVNLAVMVGVSGRLAGWIGRLRHWWQWRCYRRSLAQQ